MNNTYQWSSLFSETLASSKFEENITPQLHGVKYFPVVLDVKSQSLWIDLNDKSKYLRIFKEVDWDYIDQ